MINFPSADEFYYNHTLNNILEKMLSVTESFVDITLCNNRIENYLKSQGYNIQELRYEYKDNKFGYWGRTKGDGTCLLRISWGDLDWDMKQQGDFRK